jgi:hypothetical protein
MTSVLEKKLQDENGENLNKQVHFYFYTLMLTKFKKIPSPKGPPSLNNLTFKATSINCTLKKNNIN